DPQHVGSWRLELPVHEIGYRGWRRLRRRGADPTRWASTSQAGRLHQPRYALAANVMPLGSQLSEHAGHTVLPARSRVDCPNLRRQRRWCLLCPCGRPRPSPAWGGGGAPGVPPHTPPPAPRPPPPQTPRPRLVGPPPKKTPPPVKKSPPPPGPPFSPAATAAALRAP